MNETGMTGALQCSADRNIWAAQTPSSRKLWPDINHSPSHHLSKSIEDRVELHAISQYDSHHRGIVKLTSESRVDYRVVGGSTCEHCDKGWADGRPMLLRDRRI